MNEFNEKRKQIKHAEIELDILQRELRGMEADCPHNRNPDNWEVTYTPERHEGYTIPGDPPGTMGVDWRGPCEVPPKTIDKWTRKCKICGKVEVTDRVKETPIVKRDPKW